MNIALLGLIFLAALVATLTRGPAVAFAVVYLPTLLLFNLVVPFSLSGLTDATADVAAVYGILLGLLPHLGERLPFKLILLDWVLIAMGASQIVTSITTAVFYTGVSTGSSVLVTMLVPYFLARAMIASPEARRLALEAVIAVAVFLGIIALIEARLWPYFFSRLMIATGLAGPSGDFVYHRYGFMRARATFVHPIDFGNVAVELIGMTLFLAATTASGTRRFGVKLAVGALAACVLASISFTAFVGLAALLAVFLLIRHSPLVRRHLGAVAILGILGGVAMTTYLLGVDVNFDRGAGIGESSLMNRAMIVQRGLQVGLDAGPFGRGANITRDELQLESVDNSYLLALIRNGWVYLALMLAIPVVIGAGASRALCSPRGRAAPFPLAILVASVFGTMAGMYTVWFGFTYAILFMVLLGLTNGTIQLYLAGAAAPARSRVPATSRATPFGHPA